MELFDSLTGPHPRRALGRAITLVESSRPEDQAEAAALIALTEQHRPPKPTFRLGISGTPGVGKSTFIEAYGLELLKRGHRVAVLAIDPTSSLSGGSILGDKTRMELLTRESGVFIRPSPNSGTSGGVRAGYPRGHPAVRSRRLRLRHRRDRGGRTGRMASTRHDGRFPTARPTRRR